MFTYSNLMDIQSMQQRRDGLFSKIDSDGSGGLDKTEFSTLAKKMSEISENSINVDDVYSKYDEDGDGLLSKAELDSFMKDNPPSPPPMGQMDIQSMQQRLEDLLSKIDSDSDGAISKSEFETFVKDISEKTGNSIDVNDVFSQHDTDSDNSISLSELDSFMKDNPPPPPDDMQNAMSAYGMNMSTDQLLSLLDLLKNNQSSDGNAESTNTINLTSDFVSNLLDTLSKMNSVNTYFLVNVQA